MESFTQDTVGVFTSFFLLLCVLLLCNGGFGERTDKMEEVLKRIFLWTGRRGGGGVRKTGF